MNENKSGNFWLGFFLGGLIGAFILYLLGTKEGRKKLEKIIEQAETYEEELEEKVANLQRHGEIAFNEVEEKKEKVKKGIDGNKNTIKDNFTNRMDQALNRFENLQKKGIAFTKEAQRKFFRKNGKSLNT